MRNEQLNLYGNMELFKATGKTPEELEADAKKEIAGRKEENLKGKIDKFIDDKAEEIRRTMNREKDHELGMMNIADLARSFAEGTDAEEIQLVRTLLAKLLAGKGYKLSKAVEQFEVEGRDDESSAEKTEKVLDETKPDSTLSRDELRKAREKLPPQQRGIPNSDL